MKWGSSRESNNNNNGRLWHPKQSLLYTKLRATPEKKHSFQVCLHLFAGIGLRDLAGYSTLFVCSGVHVEMAQDLTVLSIGNLHFVLFSVHSEF